MKETDTPIDNSRRNILLGSAAVSASLLASNSFAAMDHSQHNMENPHSDIIDAALSCVKKGDACVAHCIHLIQMGNKDMADCLKSVTDMLPMCNTLAKLAASQSPHLAEFAKVCIAVCEDCEKECDKHADKHEACKACRDSCRKCIKQCKKLVA